MQIQYKTRGGASPVGKANIWLAMDHPESALIEELASDLLSHQNCAVWYISERDTEGEAELSELFPEMQLMVVAVTTDILRGGNHVIDREFPYAAEHHIPVLPILCEGGLESIFNERFGSLHCLNRVAQDVTTRTYNEKLGAYLATVLHSDEETAHIRAVFKESLFLSYRKKDRVYAQKLMRAIHAREEMRDTAIWYDEYLIPGENFNDAILASLDRSNAFLLAVTPNLVNEDNYVQSVEYPRALASGKTVIPVEMVPTDRAALRGKYAGLTEVLSEEDEAALRARILACRTTSPEEKKSLEKRYLLALAYLSGIDTEIDPDYARDALYDCALAGMPKAIEQLASMYHYGIGVEKNNALAINWYRRLAYLHDMLLKETPCHENKNARLAAYERLGDAYLEFYSFSEANGAYMNALYDYDRESEECPVHFARLYEKLGLTYKRMKDDTNARVYYIAALKLRMDMERSRASLQAIISLAYRIGDAYLSTGNSGEDTLAERFYHAALRAMEALLPLGEDEETLRLGCVIVEKLGDYYCGAGNADTAHPLYEEYIRQARRLFAQYPSPVSRRLVAIALERLGNAERDKGSYEVAVTYYRESLAIREEIRRERDTYEAVRDIAVMHQKLGTAYLKWGRLDEAGEHIDLSFDMSAELYEKTDSFDAAYDSAVAMERRGDLAVASGVDTDIALEIYQQALHAFKGIRCNLLDPPLYLKLAPTYTMDRIGDTYFQAGDTQHAKEYYQKALSERRFLHRYHASKALERDIGASFANLMNVALHEGNLQEARKYEGYACNPREAVMNESASVSYRRSFDDPEDNEAITAGDEAYEEQDYKAAATCYLTALREGYLAKDDRANVFRRLESIALLLGHRARGQGAEDAMVSEIWSSLADKAYTDDYLRLSERANR